MTENESVLKAQVSHLQKRLRDEEKAWKESAKVLYRALRRSREEAEWLAGRLAGLKACRRQEGCRSRPGDMRCITCWSNGAEDVAAAEEAKRGAEAEAQFLPWADEDAGFELSFGWASRPLNEEEEEASEGGHGPLAVPCSGVALAQPFDLWPLGLCPEGWTRLDSSGPSAMFRREDGGLLVESSLVTDDDGRKWLHVSLRLPDGLPSWEDLKLAKRLFIGPEATAWQGMAPDSGQDGQPERAFHLWASWPLLKAEGAGKEKDLQNGSAGA